jgi:8-oxo-dGTP pyrophosphatase MutT (NUDIX family)
VTVGFAGVEAALRRRPARAVEGTVSSRAAVALVLRAAEAGLELLFIQRAEQPDDPWSGQMAFPGGRCEAGDQDLAATAVRETREEIGLDLAIAGEKLGRLDEVRAMSRMRPLDLAITPFVFRLRCVPRLSLSEEVAAAHWISLDALLGPAHRDLIDYAHGDVTLRLPCFRVDGRVIWGLTYRMFANLQVLIDGRDAPSEPVLRVVDGLAQPRGA